MSFTADQVHKDKVAQEEETPRGEHCDRSYLNPLRSQLLCISLVDLATKLDVAVRFALLGEKAHSA